jgi:hypothetical protein
MPLSLCRHWPVTFILPLERDNVFAEVSKNK